MCGGFMKHFLGFALAMSLSATAAISGGFAEPLMEPEVIAEEAAAGSTGFLVPLLLLAVVAIAISSSNSTPAVIAVPKK